MAHFVDRDPATYSREKDSFLSDLKAFHDARATPFRMIPQLCGTQVDLYLLYNLVTERGGWVKVNQRNQWGDFFEPLKIPRSVNASIALKHIYLRYLDRYEKLNFLGEEADRGSDDDDENRHKRWNTKNLHSVPLTYNYNQHCIAESARDYNHLSTQLYKQSDYDRLALSLISPLPNEQDFAINVCTLLSNDGKHTLKLEKHPRILDYLLAHAAVFNHVSMRRLVTHCYASVRKQNMENFWRDALPDPTYLDLADEEAAGVGAFFHRIPHSTAVGTCRTIPLDRKRSRGGSGGAASIAPGTSGRFNRCPSKDVNDNNRVKRQQHQPDRSPTHCSEATSDDPAALLAVGDDNDDSDCELFAPEDSAPDKGGGGGIDTGGGSGDYDDDDVDVVVDDVKAAMKKKWDLSEDERQLFNLGSNLGTREYMGQRVLQIATILRNLSFIDENIPTLAHNRTFIRFMLLCSAARWNQLQNLGLDMLCNVSADMIMRDVTIDRLPAAMLRMVNDGLHGGDRHWCICALEVLNKLSQNEHNEELMMRVLERDMYRRVCEFLTIHDVMLLIYTLECLYSLSSLGERSCNMIVGTYGAVDTLVSLVTVEGKSYGPKACIGMKLVETVIGGPPPVAAATATPAASPQPATQPQQAAPSNTPVSSPQQQQAQPATMVVNVTTAGVSAPGATPVNLPPNGVGAKSVTTMAPSTTLSTGTTAALTPATATIAALSGSGAMPSTPQRTVNVNPRAIATPAVMASSGAPTTTATVPAASLIATAAVKQAAATVVTPSGVNRATATTTNLSAITAAINSGPAITAQQLVQQQHAHQQAIQENEQFALTWLRTTYEPCMSSGRVESQELYKHYINSCAKIGRRGVIAPLHFPRCVRSVFGGTVGPNPAKAIAGGGDPLQYYDGIKVRAQPLAAFASSATCVTSNATISAVATTITANTSPANSAALPSPPPISMSIIQPANSKPLAAATSVIVSPTASSTAAPPPALPSILKAQLSAPPKPTPSSLSPTTCSVATTTATTTTTSTSSSVSGDLLSNSQMKSHPHLTQALLTTGSASTTVTANAGISVVSGQVKIEAGQTNTSLIKSLLANKVNECMPGMKSDCQSVAQVAARQQQQRLAAQLQQQQQMQQQMLAESKQCGNKTANKTTDGNLISPVKSNSAPSMSLNRLNGARQQLFSDLSPDSSESTVTSTTNLAVQHMTISSSKHQSPLPPPPLTPIGNNGKQIKLKIDNEDSDSIGNNSIASSTGMGVIGISCVSSTEDGDNSLTSFEGLMNGGAMEVTMGMEDENSSSKDSMSTSSSARKPLMLADLLEKKVDPTPVVNGVMGKDRGLELVENHLVKVLETGSTTTKDISVGVKRDASNDELSNDAPDAKKPNYSGSVNGNNSCSSAANSPAAPDSVSSSNGDEGPATVVSTAAAKLFADFAADILEDEDDDMMEEDAPLKPASDAMDIDENCGMQMAPIASAHQQVMMTQQQQPQLIVTSGNMQHQQPRQIIVSQSSSGGGVMLQPGTQLKTQTGQTVIVQNTVQQRPAQMIVQQGSGGPILLSQGGQMLVATPSGVTSGGAQYVIQTTGGVGNQNFVMAQQQTAVVGGQQQTVLVAQQPTAMGSSKTIIILQPQQAQAGQSTVNATTMQQKLVMTPQGPQVIVTPTTPTLTTRPTTPSLQQQIVVTTQQAQQPTVTVVTSTPSGIVTTNKIVMSTGNTKTIPMPPLVVNSNIAAKSVTASATPNTTINTRATTSSSCSGAGSASSTSSAATSKNIETKKAVAKDPLQLFVCEWSGCNLDTKFKSANQVFMHVCETHCADTVADELQCQWERCDNMRRKRFSLMTHVQDKHCTLEAMKVALIKRKQSQNMPAPKQPDPPAPNAGTTTTTPSTTTSTTNPQQQHPGYAPDAALHAIKRHALEFVNPKELQDDNEGPVTKSIRLTASLILRNLVIYGTNCKRLLKPYEPHLANVALSNVESSRTIAQVLYDLNDNSPHFLIPMRSASGSSSGFSAPMSPR